MRRQPECCAFCGHRIRLLRVTALLNGRLVPAHRACQLAHMARGAP